MKADHHISEETIERYVRRELAEEERRSFEEHLLDCPECFEEVQIVERFVAGVRDAARTGQLPQTASREPLRWLAPALAATLAAVLIGSSVWVIMLRNSLRESLAARNTLAQRLEQATLASAAGVEAAAGNLPIAVLRTERGTGNEAILQVPAAAREVALWMDVEPDGRYRTFSIAVLDEGGRTIEKVAGLARNGEGALAVTLPAAKLPAGRYKIELSSESPARLLASYRLRVAGQ
ncbi:MAG: zf-HC2 domain-containing protein [Bryobacteraceae bacterium]